MLAFAIAPLFYGPASDRFGRKAVVVFGWLFIVAGIGCALAQSLPTLLMWRVVQGGGACVSMTTALAIVRDLFEGEAAHLLGLGRPGTQQPTADAVAAHRLRLRIERQESSGTPKRRTLSNCLAMSDGVGNRQVSQSR
jgi:hypothetical protein